MQHSGDIMDHANKSGLHTISITLAKLGPQVEEMWITMSSFAGAKLSDIEQPFVQVGGIAPGLSLLVTHSGLRDKDQCLQAHFGQVLLRHRSS